MRKVVYYPQIEVSNLDAGTIIAYPLERRTLYYAVPSFLIIGAQKCGTRELHTWLSMHPQLRTPKKELHFFNEVINIEKEWIRYIFQPWFLLSRSEKHFRDHLFYTFEKSPAYFNDLNYGVATAKIVAQMMPSVKLILLLRNPSDRAYSAYQMGKKSTKLRSAYASYQQDFETLIHKKLQGLVHQPHEQLVRLGHYSLYLQRWLDYFTQQNIFIIFLEDFKRHPIDIMRKLLVFLELPPFDYEPHIEKNFRNLWVLKGKYSKGNRKPYLPMTTTARELLDEYYSSWNQQLQELLPQHNIPWL